MRIETDFLGQAEISSDALYGIHAWRARQNFPGEQPFPLEWYQAIGLVKQAVYETMLAYGKALERQAATASIPRALPGEELLKMMAEVAAELASGMHYEHMIVPAIQGGAGTSAHMNVNEIIANRCLVRMGERPGHAEKVHPIEHANVFQSTNDVMPTALKLAAMRLLQPLEDEINALRSQLEKLEKGKRHLLRMAHTQMQRALPSSYGMLFGAYNEALSRDWWRVSKCFERIKVVNLGGGATGSGMALPRYYIMEVTRKLQKLSGLPLTRSENLSDATQNLDALVEVHAILKASAVNLEKIAADMRLLSSDAGGMGELVLPPRQAGSSMMPGKVNPVIPEYVISVSHKVYSHDVLLTGLCGQGSLDLNPYLPVIGCTLLDSIKMLKNAVFSLHHFLFAGLGFREEVAYDALIRSPGITTALLPEIGFDKATELALHMKNTGCDLLQANIELALMPDERLRELLRPDQLLRLGYTLKK